MKLLFLILQSPGGFDLPLVTALTAFIALPVKFIVDVVKGALRVLPPAVLPLVGVAVGFLFALLVLVAVKTPFDASVYAQCGIAAVGAQVAAAAVTWNQTRADQVDKRIETALNLPTGSTVSDVQKVVDKENAK